MWALKHFRHYLLGHKCILDTDHAACTLMLKSSRPLARWALVIQEMNLEIRYKSGKGNTNADALSAPDAAVSAVTAQSCQHSMNVQDQAEFNDISQLQRQDPELIPMIQYLEEKKLPEEDQHSKRIVLESPHFELVKGVLYRENPHSPGKWCVVVPKNHRHTLLHEAHNGRFSGYLAEIECMTH